MKISYYKDFCGATASITEHRDGTATLKMCVASKKSTKKYKNKKSALSVWRRYCS